MSLIGDLIAQIHDDFIEGLEMADVLSYHLLGGGVCFSPHQSVQSFFIISNDFPGTTYGGKYFRQILNPAIEITILESKLMILPPVGL